MALALLADYADNQQGCVERSKNLHLGQQAASGCEHYVPAKGSGSSTDRRDPDVLWSFQFGGSFMSPRDTIPWQAGLGAGLGVALLGSTWEIGARGRGGYHPRPTDDRTWFATLSPYFGWRFALTPETTLRLLGGVGVGSFWIADRGPEGRLDVDVTAHIASTTAPHSRLAVGPLIRLGRSFSLIKKDHAWTLTAEVGLTL